MAESALLTTLLTLAVDWLKTKTAASRRRAGLDESIKHVRFLEEWYRIRNAVSPEESDEIRNRVVPELDAIRERVKALQIPVVNPPPSPFRAALAAKLGRARRWFLFYKQKRSISWLPLALFYLCALLTVNEACWILYLLIGDVSGRGSLFDIVTWEAILDSYFSFSAVPRMSLNLGILLVVSLAMRRLALVVDEKCKAGSGFVSEGIPRGNHRN